MWEDFTVVLCGIGFTAAVAIILAELPSVLDPSRPRSRLRGH